MKIKIPSKTVDACDICGRESSFLTKCVVCGKDYCNTCEAIICGCIHHPDLCKECRRCPEVEGVVDRFVKPLLAILHRRNKALRSLRRKAKAYNKNNQPK